jgi:hypothetical protein
MDPCISHFQSTHRGKLKQISKSKTDNNDLVRGVIIKNWEDNINVLDPAILVLLTQVP